MRRSALHTLGLALVATFGLFTAAWAAGAPLPLVPALSGQSARAVVRSTSGPLLRSSVGNQAILVAQNLRPGESRSSDITISNDGDDAGVMSLAAQDLVDTGPAHLSGMLDMLVQDITDPHSPSMVWGGKVDDMGSVGLGTFAPGGQHTYRFFVTYPGGHSSAVDNQYQGTSTRVTFLWAASGVAAPPNTTTTTPPPVTPVTPPVSTDAPPINSNPAVIEDHVEQSTDPGTLKLRVYVRRTQAAHRKQVYVNVYCNHRCTLAATGVVSLPSKHKTWSMRVLKGSVKKNGTVKFKLPLPKKALGPLNTALLHHKKASVKLKITAKSGKQTLHWTRTIHLAR